MKRLLLKTLIAAVAVTGLGLAHAQASRTIRFATQSTDGQAVVLGMKRFAELVAQASGGRLKVEVLSGSAGGSEQASLSTLQGGGVDMAAIDSGVLASLMKEFGIFDMPFLFASTAEADAVLDGSFGQGMHGKLERKGMVGLGYYEVGFRELTNSKRPIGKVEDLAGLKLRVIPTPVNVDWVRAVGATPTPLPLAELRSALEQRSLDGEDNPVATIVGARLYEVQKYLTLTDHQYEVQSILVNRKFWDALPAGDRKVVQDAVRASIVYEREQSRSQLAGNLEALKKAGVQVAPLPPAEAAKLRQQMQPLIARHAGSVAAPIFKAVMAELEKLRR